MGHQLLEALVAAKARGVKIGDPDIGRRKAAAADALAEVCARWWRRWPGRRLGRRCC